MRYEDYPWYASLLGIPGLGISSLRRAMMSLGSARAIADADPESLVAIGMRAPVADACCALNAPTDTRRWHADWLASNNIALVSCIDAAFPPLLASAPAAPALLFVDGNPAVLMSPQLAMVGSRRPTPAGSEAAAQLASAAVDHGLTITSGMALGIDAQAHAGALAANGCTIAVTGTGPDIVYPRRHQRLARQIVEQGGAVISEFVPGTRPDPTNFPRRNRIISGLSLGVLVVEATLPSGSLITAQYAAEQGREVMAVPGSPQSLQSRGTNNLIRQGASLVESIDDVLTALGMEYVPSTDNNEDTLENSPSHPLMQWIGYESTPLGLISQRSGMAVAEMMAALSALELSGAIELGAGGAVRVGSKRAHG